MINSPGNSGFLATYIGAWADHNRPMIEERFDLSLNSTHSKPRLFKCWVSWGGALCLQSGPYGWWVSWERERERERERESEKEREIGPGGGGQRAGPLSNFLYFPHILFPMLPLLPVRRPCRSRCHLSGGTRTFRRSRGPVGTWIPRSRPPCPSGPPRSPCSPHLSRSCGCDLTSHMVLSGIRCHSLTGVILHTHTRARTHNPTHTYLRTYTQIHHIYSSNDLNIC